ncbi:MerR family transcriptional regulator [Nesterenkonia flava]|uniref:MerR family transcriptional regulator n=1 Tax=Nesterenkonia flava TaxID=469799 RepID=A0ABU1FWF7_9MICC|nr:MerR family transcriptional regulator [Nesterenkonia flava]MDR5713019.1 MerR family transcriptional regulator [Nesterenkonia flava]
MEQAELNRSTRHIGEVAEMSGMSLRTLRHYDDEGLLTPSGRSAGGFRLYTDEDIERLMLIRRMKPLGFSIEQMRELLELTDTLAQRASPEAAEKLQGFLAEAHQRRERLAEKIEMADDFIARVEAELQQATGHEE